MRSGVLGPAESAKQVFVAQEDRSMDAKMTFIVWAVLGLAIGAVAKMLMPGNDPGGLVVTSLIGIVGAVIGGYLANAFGLGSYTGLTASGLVIAVMGSVLLLTAYRMTRRHA
jgi:uncharacterized membrane protein YeaQ/YmgE (transglycosylase-associated protein family)